MAKRIPPRGSARHVLLTACVVAGALALATAAQAAGGKFGFFGGLNIANMGGDAEAFGQALAIGLETEVGGSWSSSKGSASGMGFGLYYYIPSSPTLGFQIEAQYIRRGVKFDLTGTNVTGVPGQITGDTKFKLDRFEIPLLLRFSPATEGSVQAMILLGPVFSFQASSDLEASFMGQSMSGDASDAFKSTTFGALGGVGMTIRAGETSAVVLQARYYLGLSNAFDDPSGTFDSKHGDFGFFAGMEFGIGK